MWYQQAHADIRDVNMLAKAQIATAFLDLYNYGYRKFR